VLQVDARGVKKAGKKGNIDIFKDKYNWRGPAMFEGAWAEEAARVANTLPLAARFSVLNVSFLDARADGHVAGAMRYSPTRGKYNSKWKAEFPIDCLHYCFPGPADFWTLTLYNMMLNNARFAL
jgi:hypothetical protein|tara:strand:- start:51 stop:422 length:372 start_codon:yes stop_codon:yes gene_type:complete